MAASSHVGVLWLFAHLESRFHLEESMKTATIAVIALAALCGCAQTTNLSSSPAEQHCGALARGDGMRVNDIRAAEGTGGAQNVRLQLEDAVGRKFDATCTYSTASGASWLAPLPANAARR